MKYYTEEYSNVLSELDSCENGLTNDEAAKRLEKNGKNKLKEGKLPVQLFVWTIQRFRGNYHIFILAMARR